MARRGENIYKRKDGRWEGRYKSGYTNNGKPKYLVNMDRWEFYLKCDAYNKVDGCNDSVVIRCYTVKFKDTPFYDEFKKQHWWND